MFIALSQQTDCRCKMATASAANIEQHSGMHPAVIMLPFSSTPAKAGILSVFVASVNNQVRFLEIRLADYSENSLRKDSQLVVFFFWKLAQRAVYGRCAQKPQWCYLGLSNRRWYNVELSVEGDDHCSVEWYLNYFLLLTAWRFEVVGLESRKALVYDFFSFLSSINGRSASARMHLITDVGKALILRHPNV